MENNENENLKKNFQFVFSVNQKILFEYLLSKGLTEKELNQSDILFISFLVKTSTNTFVKFKTIENEKYFFINNEFILNNLIFLNVKDRQIGIMIKKLVKLGIIKRQIENKNTRYLKVDDFILTNWNTVNDDLTISELLKKFKPLIWAKIENDFSSYKNFDLWIVDFDNKNLNTKKDTEKISGELWKWLETCKRNELSKQSK